MNSIKVILKWVYGFSFFIAGLGFLFSSSFIGGVLLFVCGIIVFPPSLKLIEAKIDRVFSSKEKIFAVVTLFFLAVILITTSQVKDETKQKEMEQAEFDKLPQYQKDSINLFKLKEDSINLFKQEEEKAKELLKNRDEVIQNQFSAWDGSHPGLTKIIKSNMNDPDSYEHIETRFIDNGNSILVITEFRGNNAFGAKVKNSVSATVDFEGNVIEIISQN